MAGMLEKLEEKLKETNFITENYTKHWQFELKHQLKNKLLGLRNENSCNSNLNNDQKIFE